MSTLSHRPARAAALQRQQEQIDANVAQITAAKRASALDVLASRLNISPVGLKNTLMNTVFRVRESGQWRSPTDDEFAALIIVANEYKLNPLTREIYAYPQKGGGGIVPLVAVDGWIKLMNSHPQFDGIEFKDIPDANGNLLAIEATIWRKDRSRPTRVTEYLDECKRDTDPWRISPARMLRHRALIQCSRVAFGFSGIYADGDELIGDIGPATESMLMPMRNITPQRNDEAPAAAPLSHDASTGEIMTEGWDESSVTDENDDPLAPIFAEIDARTTVPDINSYVASVDLSLLDDDQAAEVRAYAAERSEQIKKASAR